MINDRVNCMRYMFTSWRGTYAPQIDYSLEYAKVLLRKTFYHLWQGGGLCKGVTACVEKIKILKFDVLFDYNAYLCSHERVF